MKVTYKINKFDQITSNVRDQMYGLAYVNMFPVLQSLRIPFPAGGQRSLSQVCLCIYKYTFITYVSPMIWTRLHYLISFKIFRFRHTPLVSALDMFDWFFLIHCLM